MVDLPVFEAKLRSNLKNILISIVRYIFLERDKKIESYKLPEDLGVKQIRKQTHVKD